MFEVYSPTGPNSTGRVGTDIYVVEDIDAELQYIKKNIEEIILTMYKDMETIDSMQSKYLDEFADEATIIYNELNDLMEALGITIDNNHLIFNSLDKQDKTKIKEV